MPDLYPKFDMPDLVEAVEDTSVAYPKSWLFDFDTGDFVLDGAGKVVEADGLTAWAQWCVKAVLTQRLAFVVYNWDYGVDIENVMKQPTRAVTEAELEKEITEALMTDPRTAEVKNFTFEWSGDELTVSFIIVNAAGVPAEIRVGVGYREVMREFSISKVEQTISDWLRGELVNVEPTENGELVIKSVAQPTFTRDSIAYKSDGSQAAKNVPRFEAGKFGQGIMIEEGTTNLLLYSEEFEYAIWVKIRATIAANVAIAPNGTRTADKLVEDTSSSNTHYIMQTISKSASKIVYSASVYAKQAERTKFYLSVGGSTLVDNVRVLFDLSTGTAGTPIVSGNFPSTGLSASILSVGNGWYRCSLTFTSNTDTSLHWTVHLVDASGSSIYTGDGTSGIYIWGAQLEEKTFTTSYMQTTSSTATRSPETLAVPTAGVLNPQEGEISVWVYVNSTVRRQDGKYNGLFYIPGSPGGYLLLSHEPAGAYWRLTVYDGTTSKITSCLDSLTPDGWHMFTLKWNAAEAVVLIDGVRRATIASPPLPSGFAANMYLGGWPGGGGYLNTLFADLRISNRARTDAEILSAYQSNQPLPIDENTTYALRFDNNLKVGRGGYRRNKIYLQSLGTCQGSHIEWSAEIPTNTTAKVYTSLDDVNFTEAVNGAAIEGLSEGVSLSDKALTIKQTMTTDDVSITPKFNRLQYSIDGKVYLRG